VFTWEIKAMAAKISFQFFFNFNLKRCGRVLGEIIAMPLCRNNLIYIHYLFAYLINKGIGRNFL
jgi:hypothetical protein